MASRSRSKSPRAKAKQAIRDLTHIPFDWQATPAEMFHGDWAFEGELNISDQAVALVSVSNLDVALKEALLSRFVTKNPDDIQNLFGRDAPLASFNSKIRMAHAIGLIGGACRDDLIIIQLIPARAEADSRGIPKRREV